MPTDTPCETIVVQIQHPYEEFAGFRRVDDIGETEDSRPIPGFRILTHLTEKLLVPFRIISLLDVKDHIDPRFKSHKTNLSRGQGEKNNGIFSGPNIWTVFISG